MTKPSWGITFPVSNPLSMGYYAYLAAADGWSQVADEVVVVDGGSRDGSLELLQQWLGTRSNVRIVQTPTTCWGRNQKFHPLQVNINASIGLEHLHTDWGIFVGGDYVPLPDSVAPFVHELESAEDELVLQARRYKMVAGRLKEARTILFPQVLNLRSACARGIRIGYGVSNVTRTISDYPHIMDQKTMFLDPANGVSKTLYSGDLATPSRTVSLWSVVYGHTFFTTDQALAKSRIFDYAFSRYLGMTMSSDLAIKLRQNLYAVKQYYSKAEVLAWDHPSSIKAVIDQYYAPPMLGGAAGEPPGWWRRLGPRTLRASAHSDASPVMRFTAAGIVRCAICTYGRHLMPPIRRP